MKKSSEQYGKTVEEAIRKGLEELKVSRDDVKVEILEEPSNGGILGMISAKMAKVRVTVDKKISDSVAEKTIEKVEKILKEIFDITGESSISYSVNRSENQIIVNIKGDNVSHLIGYKGKTIESIQSVLNSILQKEDEEYAKVFLEINDYKKQKEELRSIIFGKNGLKNLQRFRNKKKFSDSDRIAILQEFMGQYRNNIWDAAVGMYRQIADEKEIENISIAATLHDIGKVGIPDNILNKAGKLTDEEYEIMKSHTIIGRETLESTYSDKLSSEVLEYAKDITLHHHEKYNGTGYPEGLKGDEITIISRIMAIIDVYDALANDRVYKKAMPPKEVEEYIVSQSGTAFDPKLINVFLLAKDELARINKENQNKGSKLNHIS